MTLIILERNIAIKLKCLLTDADNLKYKTEAENADKDFYKVKGLFDFRNYPEDSKYYSNANEKGKMKDATCENER